MMRMFFFSFVNILIALFSKGKLCVWHPLVAFIADKSVFIRNGMTFDVIWCVCTG